MFRWNPEINYFMELSAFWDFSMHFDDCMLYGRVRCISWTYCDELWIFFSIFNYFMLFWAITTIEFSLYVFPKLKQQIEFWGNYKNVLFSKLPFTGHLVSSFFFIVHCNLIKIVWCACRLHHMSWKSKASNQVKRCRIPFISLSSWVHGLSV